MYVSVAEVRAAGLCVGKTDAEITPLITAASAKTELWTRLFFEPRARSFVIRSSGGRSLCLPFPALTVLSVTLNSSELDISGIYIMQDGWVLTREDGWAKGILCVSGTFGVVEGDDHAAPAPIKEAVLRLVAREVVSLSDVEGQRELVTSGRVVSETTDGHSYSLATPSAVGEIGSFGCWTGDPLIDSILINYQKPSAIGAA